MQMRKALPEVAAGLREVKAQVIQQSHKNEERFNALSRDLQAMRAEARAVTTQRPAGHFVWVPASDPPAISPQQLPPVAQFGQLPLPPFNPPSAQASPATQPEPPQAVPASRPLDPDAALSMSVEHTDLPEDTPPRYSMCRTHKSVHMLWREWNRGINGGPAVKVLEQRWGARWRPEPKERVFFGNRKVIMDELRKRTEAKGGDEQAAILELDGLLRDGNKSLDWLSKAIKRSNKAPRTEWSWSWQG